MVFKKLGLRVKGKLGYGLRQSAAAALLLVRFSEVKAWAARSLLDPSSLQQRLQKRCPVCGSEDYKGLIRLPLGIPGGQNHSLLYYDYAHEDAGRLSSKKELLDRTLGFFVSVPWNFCNRCKNASLAVDLSQDQLDRYCEQHYTRFQSVHPNRQRTKALHGHFFSSHLKPNSRVLDFGAAEGMTASFLAQKGHDVIACEISKNYEEALRRGPFKFVKRIDGVPEESLDGIYLHHVLEHLRHPVDFLTRFNRLLKPEGLLMIQVPDLSLQLLHYPREASRCAQALANRVTCTLTECSYEFRKDGGTRTWLDALDNNHPVAFTPEGLRYALESALFAVEKVIQSKPERIEWDPNRYAWAVDKETGNTPNGLTILARKRA